MDRVRQRRDLPRIAFFVEGDNDGLSAGLRAYQMAEELRKFSWRTVVIPKQLEFSQRHRLIHLEQPEIVILQKSRHPLNRPKYFPDSICLFDIDDADFAEPNFREGAIECMRESACVIAGSTYIAEFARQFNRNVKIIWTGSRPRARPLVKKEEPPIVAFAGSVAAGFPDELSLMMSALTMVQNQNWQFWLFGVNNSTEGARMVEPLRRKGIACRVFPFMGYQKLLRLLESVSVGLAPLVPTREYSSGKSFGKVLTYLNCRVAVVASNVADHPLFFQNGINGFLASTAEDFAEKINLLISDRNLREQIAGRAYEDYVDQLSLNSAARKMDALLRPLLKS